MFFLVKTVLREESHGVLKELEDGGIASTMITGDSVLTGVCIARASGMIKKHKKVILGQKVSDLEMEWVVSDTDATIQ